MSNPRIHPEINLKWNAFATAIADGKSCEEAYQIAGYAGNKHNARRLKQHPWIIKRVSEILADRRAIVDKAIEHNAEKLAVTREWVIDKLVENVNRAMDPEAYQGGVACRALELLGKEIGMFIERRESLNINYAISDQPLDSDEWAVVHAGEKRAAN
jgi:phage terminase small subunit